MSLFIYTSITYDGNLKACGPKETIRIRLGNVIHSSHNSNNPGLLPCRQEITFFRHLAARYPEGAEVRANCRIGKQARWCLALDHRTVWPLRGCDGVDPVCLGLVNIINDDPYGLGFRQTQYIFRSHGYLSCRLAGDTTRAVPKLLRNQKIFPP